MKKIAGLLLLGYVLLNSGTTFGQSYAESALLFSRINPGGSARIQAMGGAQVSLGGDYSSAFSNPAGLGMYNRSEFTITPGFLSSRSSAEYLGNSSGDGQSKVIIPGISFVFHSEKNIGKLLGGTFGISVNRINDFNRTFNYSGVNHDNSIVDYFVGVANSYGRPPDQLFYTDGLLYNDPTGLAWDNYLVNVNQNGDGYAPDTVGVGNAVNFFGRPTQHEQVQTKGSQYQVSISYAINLSDKLFIGAGVGLTSLDFTSRKTYTETFPGDSVLSSLLLAEGLHITGSGINLTLGTVYRPADFFQLGFSVATPTLYSLNDSYSAYVATDWRHFPYGAGNLPQGPIYTDPEQLLATYALQTPWKLSGGLTFFILKRGLISVDVDHISYASSSYSSQTDGIDLTSDNTEIKDSFRSVWNFRAGGEYRLKQFRLRAGYSLMPDPYKAVQNNVDTKVETFSGGIGYRTSKFYVDLTAVLPHSQNWYSPYTGAPIVTTRNNATTVMMTVGFPF